MFSTFSLKAKIISLCVILSAVTLLVGGTSYFSMQKVSENYGHVAEVNLPKSKLAEDMFLSYRSVRIHLRTLAIPGVTREQGEKEIAGVTQAIEAYGKAEKAYLDTDYATGVDFGPGEEKLWNDVQERWKAFQEVGVRAVKHYNNNTPEDLKKMYEIFLVDCPREAQAYTVAVTKLINYQEKEAKAWVGMAQDQERASNYAIIFMVFGGTVAALFIGVFFANSITKAIRTVSEQLSEGANSLASTAESLRSSSQELSSSATEQAAALQETSSAIEETSAMVSKNADNAKRSASVSAESQNTVIRGKEAVDQVILSISEIARSNAEVVAQIEEGNREISDIVKVIAEIGNKTKVINDIVFQTKLLSFNASVEAARAGENGKGFAVVAEEVGNLAQMSGRAAKEISDLLDQSISKVDGIIQNTKNRVEHLVVSGREKVEVGTTTARHCGDVLEEVVRNVGEVGIMVNEISAASQEQSQGIQEITKAMAQLDEAAQLNHAGSQQSATSAENLANLVEDIRSMVSDLNQTLNGAGSQSSPSAARQFAKPVVSLPAAPKVVSITAAKKSSSVVNEVPSKKAAGSDLPSQFDEGFREV